MVDKLAACEIRDWLLEQGRAFISSEELCERIEVRRDKLPDALRAIRNRGEIARVCRGGWAAVEPDQQKHRSLSPATFLDDMMNYLGHDYQVGFAAAAVRYGATYRIPSTVRVLTAARMGQITIGLRPLNREDTRNKFISRLMWVYRFNPSQRGVSRQKWHFNEPPPLVNYSVPEVTALDCVLHPRKAVGWVNIMNILPRMIRSGSLDPDKLAETALLYPLAVRQRLGTALDISAEHEEIAFDTAPLRDTLPKNPKLTRIMPECEHYFAPSWDPQELIYINKKWGTIVNTILAPEV